MKTSLQTNSIIIDLLKKQIERTKWTIKQHSNPHRYIKCNKDDIITKEAKVRLRDYEKALKEFINGSEKI